MLRRRIIIIVIYFRTVIKKIYEWEQTLDTITLFIDTPPNKRTAKDYSITITSKHLKVGLKNHNTYFLDDDFFSSVDTTESTWYIIEKELDDTTDNNTDNNNLLLFELQIIVAKQKRGETWLS